MLDDEQKQEQVVIPVLRYFDYKNRPICGWCILFDNEDCSCSMGWSLNKAPHRPGPNCPIHNEEARNKMEPL